MHEQQPGQEAEPAPAPPQIYVASLADYNAGRLHGAWLDADRSVDKLQEGISAMLASSPEPGAEEWAIHDFEGFGQLRLDESTGLETISRLAAGIAEYGEPFAALAAWLGEADATSDAFEQHYRGTWNSVVAYADELLGDLGVEDYLRAVPDYLQPYVRIDTAAFARDLELEGDIYAAKVTGGVAVFDAHS